MSKSKVDIKSIMGRASEKRILIPAFNVSYLPMIRPILDVLIDMNTFALIEVSRPDVEKFEAKSFEAVVEEYQRIAGNSRLTSLHLDHIPVIDEDGVRVPWKELIQKGIELRFNSVMIDGSRLPLEENIEITSEVVRMAHPFNIPVEAELGNVFGHERGPLSSYEELFHTKQGFTSVADARRFVYETGVDWLSVACGNIHGAISGAAKDKDKVEARLDSQHIKRIKESVNNIPLVLHGGSSIRKESLLAGVRSGITKVNVGTEIRQAYERGFNEYRGNISIAQERVREKIEELITDVYQIKNSAEMLL